MESQGTENWRLFVSGIYNSNVKYKYSTVTLGVTVWEKCKLHSVPLIVLNVHLV